jgi:hypothetical membrane protein
MNVKIVKLMGVFGLLSPIVGLIMMGIAIMLTPGWSITKDTLSALGGDSFGNMIFNSGLPMAGALMMLFSTGLFEISERRIIGQIGSLLYLLASVIIVVLGVANINVQPIHNYLSVALFVLIPLSLAANSANLYSMKLKIYAALGVVGFILSAVVWATPGPVNALKETVALIGLVVWQIPLGYWMRKQVDEEEDL